MKQELIKFPNKAKLVLASRDTKVVTISVSICVGAERETKKNSGISHLIERLIRSSLIEGVSEFGGLVDSRTTLEHIEFSITSTRDHLKSVIILLSEKLFDFTPKLSSFEKEKQKILQEIEKNNFNPMAIITNMSRKIIYKGTGLANDEIGTMKSVNSLTLGELKSYYKTILTPEALVFAIVGDISDQNKNDIVSRNEGVKGIKVAKLASNSDEILQKNPLSEAQIEKLLKELEDDIDDDNDEEDDDQYSTDRDLSADLSIQAKRVSSQQGIRKGDSGNVISNPIRPQKKIDFNKTMSPAYPTLKNENKIQKKVTAYTDLSKRNKISSKEQWSIPEFVPHSKFNSSEVQEIEKTYEEIHLLIVKYIYGKTLELPTGKTKSTTYCPSKGPFYVQKTKSLNQTRFHICFPSAPYNSTGYKYSKLVEGYLNKFLRVELSKFSGVYGLEARIFAYKNNAHLGIYFAVDDEKANDVYKFVIKTLKNLKAQTISRSEFEAEKNTYITNVVVYHEKMLNLAKRYNKWLNMKDQVFDVEAEIEAIRYLKYNDFLYVLKTIFNFDEIVVACVGKTKIDFVS